MAADQANAVGPGAGRTLSVPQSQEAGTGAVFFVPRGTLHEPSIG